MHAAHCWGLGHLSTLPPPPSSFSPPPTPLHPLQFPYEEDLRVPFFIRGPGIMPGTRLPPSVFQGQMVDIAPTIMQLAGGQELQLHTISQLGGGGAGAGSH